MSAVWGFLARHRRDAVAVAVIVYALVALIAHWAPRSFVSPDGLFYSASVLEIQGTPEDEALDQIWNGPLAAPFRAADALRPASSQVLDDPEWIPYTSEFFERRQFVPLVATIVDPVAGDDNLEVASTIGAFAFALLLYALLRCRFGPFASAIAVGFCLAWPPLRWAFMPLTESWGLALMTLALLAAVKFMERGDRRWLCAWAGSILVLGFARDFTPVPILASAVLLLTDWSSHRARILLVSGVLAALPAPLIGGAALREQLAYGLSARQIPTDASWGFVFDHYPDQAETAINQTWDYLWQSRPRFLEEAWPLWPFTLPLLAGLLALFFVRLRGDPFVPLLWGGVAGGFVTFALNPFFTHYRYQLVLLPMAAAGIALIVRAISGRVRQGVGESVGRDPPGPPP